eukprot:GHVT01030822.1.p1 GENE.GHVT01030822.1~~GHVT01030822.1.p1  ORF type:complete len:458 (+),score=42.39 GHVT01030822.1:114-1487(+)
MSDSGVTRSRVGVVGNSEDGMVKNSSTAIEGETCVPSSPDQKSSQPGTASDVESAASHDENKQGCKSPCCPSHGRYISVAEVANHSTVDDAWLMYGPRVFDITSFVHSHPGGMEPLTSGILGSDATLAFDVVGHSDNAIRLMDKYAIGIVKELKNVYIEKCFAGNQSACSSITTISAWPGTSASSSSPSVSEAARSASSASAAAAKDADDDDGIVASDSRPSHKLINWEKALLPQISNLTAQQYKRLIDHPYCTTEVLKLMPYDWMEPFSKTQWYVIPLVYLPLITFITYLALQTVPSAWRISTPFFFALGTLLWTFVEYCVHRFLFHYPEKSLPESPMLLSLHFLMHAVHHLLPMDPLRLVMPPALFVTLCMPFHLTLRLIPVPMWVYQMAWAGAIFGYVCYDMIHYSTHHFGFLEVVPHIRSMKVYHMKHHYKDATKGYGVSSKLWDFVFGTVLT